MGAIFFYIFIYFLGYYGSAFFNMFTVRPIITNRFTAALVPVVIVAIMHAYMITTKPPPASQDITVESALFSYVLMPVVIVTLGAIYFMTSMRKKEEEESELAARKTAENAEDYDEDEVDGEEKPVNKKVSAEPDVTADNHDKTDETAGNKNKSPDS